MTTETKATHGMAEVEFGRFDDDNHKIYVTTYFGEDDEDGQREIMEVTDEQWESAYGSSDADKIESILGWSGMLTEHNSGVVFVTYGNDERR